MVGTSIPRAATSVATKIFAAAFAQIHQRAVTPALRHVDRAGSWRQNLFVQFIRDDFGHGFSGRENHALVDVGVAQDVVEQAVLWRISSQYKQLLFDFALIIHALNFDDFRVFG